MNDETLIRALHQIAVVDNLRCLGCGYEHHCSTHGCAIIKQAVERLQALTAPQPNEPLTLEDQEGDVPLTPNELREMVGQWVWVTVRYEHCKCVGWAFIPTPAYIAYLDQAIPIDFCGQKFEAYRRKPEEGTP